MWNLRRQRDIIESLVFGSFVYFQNILSAPGDFVLKESILCESLLGIVLDTVCKL